MRLTPKYINIFLNILFGVAWAMAIFLFIYGYSSLQTSFYLKILNAFLYFFIGLFFVLLLEAIAKIFEIWGMQREILKKLNSKDD